MAETPAISFLTLRGFLTEHLLCVLKDILGSDHMVQEQLAVTCQHYGASLAAKELYSQLFLQLSNSPADCRL